MIFVWIVLFVIALAIDDYLKPKKVLRHLFWAFVLLSIIYYNVQDTDWFVRTFNHQRWEQIEQKRAERTKERNEWLENSKFLNHEECTILLKAKESLVPIEIKKRTIDNKFFHFQKSIEKITKDIESDIKEYRSLCEELGESPYQPRDMMILEIKNLRRQLNKKIISERQFENLRSDAIDDDNQKQINEHNDTGETCYDGRGPYSC